LFEHRKNAMSTAAPSISTRISHRFTQKRGWQHTTSVQFTANYVPADPFDGEWTTVADYHGAIAWHMQEADTIARAENDRRNQIDGWTPPQENQ